MMVQSQNIDLGGPGLAKTKKGARKKQADAFIPPRGVLPDGTAVDFGHSDKNKSKQQQTPKKAQSDKASKGPKQNAVVESTTNDLKHLLLDSSQSLPDGQKPDFGGRTKKKTRDNHKQQSTASNRNSGATNLPSSADSYLKKSPRSQSSTSMSPLSSSTPFHVDENETEMFSGAASHVIPSSISSFHHNLPQPFPSPAISSVAVQDDFGELDDFSLHRVDSNASTVEFQERAKFKFFTTQQIEEAKGASSQLHNPEGMLVDYDTNWNTYDDELHHRSMSVQHPAVSIHSNTELASIPISSYGSMHTSEEELFPEEYPDEEGDLSSEHDEWDSKSGVWADVRHHDKLFGAKFPAKNTSQRFYLAEEDLVIGIAGYSSSYLKSAVYYLFIILTLGLGYLGLRWFPRYRIQMMGNATPLAKAQWVVVEDEFGVLDTINVKRHWYNRSLSSFLTKSKFDDKDDYDLDDTDPLVPILISFEYRYMKFFYDPLEDIYKLANSWIDPKWCHFPESKAGLSEDLYQSRSLIFGENLIDIKDKSVFQLLTDEILHPFYVFQAFSILLWLADSYYYYAFCIFIISVFSIADSLIETKTTITRMRAISRFECDVRVWRSGFWKEINSKELVPGDVYEVSDASLHYFPCDAILLSGDCIVNESMLTGESVPVSKLPISPETAAELRSEFASTKFSPQLAKSFLYSGTKIVRCRYASNGDEPAMALVVRTGFNTTKGSLVRSMLFPKPSDFKFYRDSFKYIGVMTVIALVGFVVSAINFIKLGLGWKTITLRALDLITIVVPPALPATLTIGTSFALSRLRHKSVFCIAPTRINVGGKLDVMCFDKTGTLTEEGLDLMGVRVSEPIRDRKERHFTDLYAHVDQLFGDAASPQAYELFLTMLSCQSLKKVEDEIVGDPLDAKTFEFTNWDMIENPVDDEVLNDFVARHKFSGNVSPVLFRPKNKLQNNTLFVKLREFEFVSQLRRMSSICQSLNNPALFNVFVKGAPEVIEDLCFPETVPANYRELLHEYTHNGYRVIACATKTMKKPNSANLTDLEFLNELPRDKCESELEFIGFLIFENRLKSSTKSSLKHLKDAELRTIMCTGDNVLTAVSVSRECGLVDQGCKVYIPSFEEYEDNQRIPIVWTEVDDPESQLDPVSLVPLDINRTDDYCIAVTGDVFKYILTELSDHEQLIEKMLMKGTVFARMSPDEKHELVDRLKSLDYTVGFCGDGANDCGALKAADVGISLSEAEASVAAPFTSRIFEISCVLDVIKEGRASLVTSFSCFQFMSLYSAIQFITVSILYKEGTNLGDFQFLYIDMFLIIPLAVFMAWSKPFDKLCPKRPTANLMSPKILIPLLGNICVLFCFQFSIWRSLKEADESWYRPPVPGDDDEVQCSDNTVLFLFANFQYIMVAMLLTVGPPYREPAAKNYPFITTVFTTSILSAALMYLDNTSWFGDLMDITWTPESLKMSLLVAACANYLILVGVNKYLFGRLSKLFKRVFGRRTSKKRFKNFRKEFKVLC
ncbi:hypothetical protein KL949_001750 [Ogataea haglerorum]|nr:hypothetical protein KL950_001160 [Ogataea haglerorum]KAG7720492.1 hypothetical protein KL913_001392 [Ogataea haglerorum]KAG7720878.1 hypothetical protein KL949_001750 [Ogataea haglerorum]KAG7760014.1 hypothetical protein KL947_001644 [Ogataea haglerorum]